MSNTELLNVRGGSVSISATMLNAIARGAEVIYNIGTSLGKCIKLFIAGKKC